jgi:hypothetical protein
MDQLETMLRMLASPNESDAAMALRGIRAAFEAQGVSLEKALLYAAGNISALKEAQKETINQAAASVPAVKPAGGPVTNASGMPECRVPKPGHIEIVLAGKSSGEVIALQGAASGDAAVIAAGFKDALAAAVINKSRMKLKLLDIKDKRGEIIETVLQAEYERQGMIPVRIWGNIRGESAALAAVLRKALSTYMPELAAA